MSTNTNDPDSPLDTPAIPLRGSAPRQGPGTVPLEDVTQMSLSPMSLHAPAQAPESGTWPTRQHDTVSSERYTQLGLLGMGGMGEVYRVRDGELNRTVAMKVLRKGLAQEKDLVARFVEEAQISAQLQHPGIVPVYEIGRRADGRLYFTMQEIQGTTLHSLIQEAHVASAYGDGERLASWSLRALLVDFHRACEAVAYAHKNNVMHRDLKPSNIMSGDNGELFVVDWGLAKVLGDAALSSGGIVTDRSLVTPLQTRYGKAAGTPAYMSPEQARGQLELVDARSDVYALGCILFHILVGHPPNIVLGDDGVWISLNAPRIAEELDKAHAPQELRQVCISAMAQRRQARPKDAGVLANDIQRWLDGAQRREQAQQDLLDAQSLDGQAEALVKEASALRHNARSILSDMVPWAPEDEKEAGWSLMEEAHRLDALAVEHSMQAHQRLQRAWMRAPDWPEPRARLAQHAARLLHQAEERGDDGEAKRQEFALRMHTEALPERHPVRPQMAAILRGVGTVTLHTDPPGAEILLHRYVPHRQRLKTEFVRSLGQSPLVEVPIEAGRYLLELRAEGHDPVSYPLHIERQTRWDGVRPGNTDATPIALPPAGVLGPDDVYVPPGWFLAGDNNSEDAALPRTRLWADGFVIRRYPVTHEEYLAFLNDLVRSGQRELALQVVPRERSVLDPLAHQAPLYIEADDGTFSLPPDSPIGIWGPGRPVLMVTWFGAFHYAQWLARTTGRPWRLPADLEWEKAARGVDGRLFPWGDVSDPSWCRIAGSQEGFRTPTPVDTYPIDCSPYGVRGMAGNAMDWCLDVFSPLSSPESIVSIPQVDLRRVSLQQERCNRGGCWVTDANFSRLTRRSGHVPFISSVVIGFRVAHSIQDILSKPQK